MEWTNLEEKIRSRDDYRKDICLAKESQSIYLFGLTKLVKEYRQLFEEIKTKVCPQACQINLSKKQVIIRKTIFLLIEFCCFFSIDKLFTTSSTS